VCTREAAAAVGPGRKTTGRGPRVGERGWLAGWVGRQAKAQRGNGEGSPKGGEEGMCQERVVPQREGRGEQAGWLKAGTGPTQEDKNPIQISFKFWIWQNFEKFYREILKEFGHGDFS
jgi:hypothetical protein